MEEVHKVNFLVPYMVLGFLLGMLGVDEHLALLFVGLIGNILEVGDRLQKKKPIGSDIIWLNVYAVGIYCAIKVAIYLIPLLFAVLERSSR